MSTFGEAAPLWLSLASRLLGWRPGEFWEATPAEIAGALRDPENSTGSLAPGPELIAHMMERDKNG